MDVMPSRHGARLPTPEIAVAVLVAALLVLCVLTFDRYGFSSDESNGLIRARNILTFFASGGIDTAELTRVRPENFYGAMADVLALLIERLIPAVGHDSRHMVSALFGVLGVYYTWRLGRRLGGRWTGAAAAGLLAFTPMWLGYSYINLKDIPFATALLAASYYGLTVMGDEERPRRTTLFALAAWCGALGTTKLTGVLLLAFTVAVLLFFWRRQAGSRPVRVLARRALLGAGAVLLGIAIFSIAFWPQLYLYSPWQTFKVMLRFLDYDPWRGNVLLDGEFFDQNHVPAAYLVTYLLITMPLLPLTLYVVSIPLALIRRRIAVLGAILLPPAFLLVQFLTQAQVYNGFRHFLFTVPFLCIGAGYGLVTLGSVGGKALPRLGAVAAFVLFAGWSTTTMVSLFPYQYSAYNALVGGVRGAENRFYIDVWRTAQREALRLINDQLPAGSERADVYACGAPINFDAFPRLRPVRDPKLPVDYFVRLPRCSLTNPEGFEVVGEVRRQGVLFAAVLRPQRSN